MATTEKGIYYQNDYTKVADILADMKKMAESIDKLIEEIEYDDKDVKNSIKTIQNEQKVQNDDIENIQTKDTEQDELIQKLQSNMIQESTEEATSLHVEDASNLPAVLSVRGNHYQEVQEGTSNLAILQEGTIEQNGNKVVVENGIATLSGTNSSDTTNYVKVGTAYLYSGKTYYINNIRTLNMGSHGALLRSKTGVVKWFTANTELEWECTNTSEWDIEISYSAGQYANGTEKFLISETSGAEWVQGKKAIPSLEYPSEIETVKDNIKIIQCNSNFLKKQEETEITGQGLTGTVSNDGTITLNGTTTGATYIQLTDELKITTYTNSQNFEKHTLPNGSYKFISETSGETSANIHAYLRNATSNITFDVNIQSINSTNKKETTFEIENKQQYTAYVWIAANTTLTNFTMKFMLKRADDTSEYIQNEQKEYNLLIQEEMLEGDYFIKEEDGWKEVHTWNKYIFTGNENLYQTIDGEFYRYSIIMENALSKSIRDIIYSNCYTSKDINIAKENLAFIYDSYIYLYSKISSKEDFKTKLLEKYNLGKAVYSYYRLAIPIKLPCTEEQKQILNELQNLELFKGTNNIYTEQDLALLQLDYTADTKMYIDNKIANTNAQVLNM